MSKQSVRRLIGSEGRSPAQIWEEYRASVEEMLDRVLGMRAEPNARPIADGDSERPPQS